MTGERKRSDNEKITPQFAKKALKALDLPLDSVEEYELRLTYRLEGVARPPVDFFSPDRPEFDDYFNRLWYRNTFKVRDQELCDLRRSLWMRIRFDPNFTDEELTEILREFYESRIPGLE